MSTDPFYMRYYSGHVGSYGHEFIEFEISGNRLRFALNTNYRNEGLLRREMYLSDATLKEFQRIVAESEITKEDDSKWPQKSVIGKQEFECRMAPYHLAFQTAKIGSLVDVQNSDDPEGLRVFYYLVQDLKIFVYSLISLHFHIKPDEEDSEEEGMLERGSEAGGLRETDLWNDETTALLREAAYKLPNLGRRHYTVQGASYGRNGLIGEFIRRRTGIARDRFQVCYRLQALIKAAKDDLTEIAKLRGATVSRNDLRGREWTTFLGPDLFPRTKPKLSKARDDDETSRELPPPVKRKKHSKSTNSSTSSAAPSQHKKRSHRKPYSDDTTAASPSSTSRKRVKEDDEAATRHFKPRPFPLLASDSRCFTPGTLFGSSFFVPSMPASYPSSSYSLFPPPSVLASTFSIPQPELSPTISPPTAAFIAPLLTSLLSATSPNRDPSSLVHALLNSGLSTSSDLVDFFSLDNSTFELFLEEFGKRNGVGPLDLAWVRKCV
ncbi:hypothetical protein JCM10049v2_002133 [Rhodotorula toruloides]